jgi:hypothetical protein
MCPVGYLAMRGTLDRLPDIRSTTRFTSSLTRTRKPLIYLGAGERIRTADLPSYTGLPTKSDE